MTEYYRCQDIVVRFEVYKDGAKVIPGSASVLVYDPDQEYIGKDGAKITYTEVMYVLEGSKVTKVGEYTFIFRVGIEQLGDYTHVVKADVQDLPVPIEDEVTYDSYPLGV